VWRACALTGGDGDCWDGSQPSRDSDQPSRGRGSCYSRNRSGPSTLSVSDCHTCHTRILQSTVSLRTTRINSSVHLLRISGRSPWFHGQSPIKRKGKGSVLQFVLEAPTPLAYVRERQLLPLLPRPLLRPIGLLHLSTD